MFPTRREAIERAKDFLLAQAEQSFAETRHAMSFPRWAGFRAMSEQQSSDVFARAVLGGVLLDIADLAHDAPAFQADLRAIARREADYVASAKLADRAGGWSYFPGLPELPPDLDSLAAALALFARVSPEHVALCEEPIALALAQMADDGSIQTWLVAPSDPAHLRAAMDWGVRACWGRGADPEVCARFYHALLAYDHRRFRSLALRGARYVCANQQPAGGWHATWYWGAVYGTSLCLGLLRALGSMPVEVERAQQFLFELQRPDGGWGVWQSVPLDTAIALLELIPALGENEHTLALAEAACRGVECLLQYQGLDGHWNASPWIKMEIGRAQDAPARTATYQSATLTTAFCLRALLAVNRMCERTDI